MFLCVRKYPHSGAALVISSIPTLALSKSGKVEVETSSQPPTEAPLLLYYVITCRIVCQEGGIPDMGKMPHLYKANAAITLTFIKKSVLYRTDLYGGH